MPQGENQGPAKAPARTELDNRAFRTVADKASDGIVVAMDDAVIYANPRLAEILSYPPERILGSRFERFVSTDELERLNREVMDESREGDTTTFSASVMKGDGSTGIVEFTHSNTLLDGKSAHIIIVKEIGDSDLANLKAKTSESKYRLLFESANDAIFTMRMDRFIDCNIKTMEMFGCERDEIIGQPPYRFSPPTQPDGRESKAAALEKIQAALGGEPQFFEWTHTRLDGTAFEAEVSLNRVDLENEVFIQALVRDISRRKKAESSLRESESLYRTLLSNLPVGVALSDRSGRLVTCNEATLDMMGFQDGAPEDADISEFYYHEGERARMLELLTSEGEIHDFETTLRRRDGQPLPVSMHVVPYVLGGAEVLLSVFEDRTEQIKAEEERRKIADNMRQAQKLESLGVLAGGIAHDFNNLLMGILGNADLALMRTDEADNRHKHLQSIKQTAQRAADLSKQMLAYSGRGRFVVEPLDLNLLIKEMRDLLSVSISKKAILDVRLSESIPAINGDATQMRQVIMNLITNASDALGDATGEISITTGQLSCDRKRLAAYHLDDNLPVGRYVFLRVTDDGRGMDRVTRDRIFDPFFTTKFTGRGLGLAAVLGIVRGHKGAILVDTAPGKGTTFEVIFPAMSDSRPLPVLNEEPEPEVDLGSGTVLVIDDEEAVRTTTQSMLESLGHKVITAKDGVDGVSLFAQNRDEISLILLDLMMPRMDGEAAFSRLRKLSSSVRIVLMSGYSEQEVSGRFPENEGPEKFIQKPFDLSRLAELLRREENEGS